MEQNGVRMYREIPRNTTRIQGTPRNTTRFQGIQGDTKGTLNKTEWYANVKQNGMRMNREIPRNTIDSKGYEGIQRYSKEYKETQKDH